jgi:site-specific DNA recombinase
LLTGKHAGGETPYGIYKEEDTTVYRINEAQAKIIRLIFDLYIQGYGYRRIAAILEEKGHKPPKGEKWNGGSIGKLLKNEAYIGIYNYTLGAGTPAEESFKLDNVYPAIIDDNTWALAQKQRIAKKPKRSKRNRLYLLTGNAVCGSCHKNYVGHSSNGKKYKYYYYRCNGRSMHARNETSCKGKDIQAEKLENWVLESISQYILSDNAIKTILDSVAQKVKSKSNTSQKEIKKLEKEAEKLDARIENMLDLYDSGKLSKARLNKRTEGLEKQLENIYLELEQLRNLNSTNVDTAALREFLFQYRNNLQNANPETKKALIDAFVDSVEITNDTIKLTLKVDDTLGSFDNFMDMTNGVVTPSHIYTKNIAANFKDIAKKKKA